MKFFDLEPQYERIGTEIERRTAQVRKHKQFVGGPEIKELETQLAGYVGVKHAIACANGTDALELSLEALGLKPGDEVITTAYSYFATAEAIERCGLKPVFVDIDPKMRRFRCH
jgi:UDP-2-acetamido-2-deoxy-ribo-hexuluronate aminotransferase